MRVCLLFDSRIQSEFSSKTWTGNKRLECLAILFRKRRKLRDKIWLKGTSGSKNLDSFTLFRRTNIVCVFTLALKNSDTDFPSKIPQTLRTTLKDPDASQDSTTNNQVSRHLNLAGATSSIVMAAFITNAHYHQVMVAKYNRAPIGSSTKS